MAADPSVPSDVVPSVAGDVIFQRVSDGAVLLSTDGEIYYGLNELGAEIWEGLTRRRDVDAICDELRDRYPGVGADRIRSDVTELLEELAGEGLLTWREPGEAEHDAET